MPPLRCALRSALAAGLAATVVAVAPGCRSGHDVKVDAIKHPQKTAGTSYRLIVRTPAGDAPAGVHGRAVAEVRNALAARGLHEAPPRAAADMEIELEYGISPGHRKIEYRARDMLGIDYWGKLPPHGGAEYVLVYDKYLKLSAREPAGPSGSDLGTANQRARGEELWSVHVIVEDQRNELPSYLPVLAAASIGYIGSDTGAEAIVRINARQSEQFSSTTDGHRKAQIPERPAAPSVRP